MQPADLNSPDFFRHSLRLASPTVVVGHETAAALRLAHGTMTIPTVNVPQKLLTKGRRQLVFPMPSLSPSWFMQAFSDNRRHPLVETTSGLKEQPWFTTPATPAWIGCDLHPCPNSGQEEKNGSLVPDAATLTAVLLLALSQKLSPMNTNFARFMSSTVTDDGLTVYLRFHNGRISYHAIQRQEARLGLVLKVISVT